MSCVIVLNLDHGLNCFEGKTHQCTQKHPLGAGEQTAEQSPAGLRLTG